MPRHLTDRVLEYRDISNCGITNVPSWIRGLSSLEYLYVYVQLCRVIHHDVRPPPPPSINACCITPCRNISINLLTEIRDSAFEGLFRLQSMSVAHGLVPETPWCESLQWHVR